VKDFSVNANNFIRRLYFSAQFVKFVLAGGVALLMNWIARILFDIWTSYSVAIFAAYAVGMATAFVLFRKYVFPASGQARRREITYFVVVNIVALPIVWIVSKFLGDVVLTKLLQTDEARALGHAIAITLPVFINFLAHKFVTFKEA
jgi:putative flippase GtrA